MTTLEACMDFVEGKINGATSLGVHEGYVPQGKALPAFVYSILNADDTRTQGDINMSRYEVMVKAVGEGKSKTALLSAYGPVETAIHKATGTVTPFAVESYRISPPMPENVIEAGKPYSQIVGTFEVIIRPA